MILNDHPESLGATFPENLRKSQSFLPLVDLGANANDANKAQRASALISITNVFGADEREARLKRGGGGDKSVRRFIPEGHH